MADLQKTISIIFQGVDEISGPINSMSKNLSSFGDGVSDFGQPFRDLTAGILAADAALAAMAIGGLTFAFNKSVEFENSVIELKKVLGGGIGADAAIDEAMRLSDIYGESSAAILESTANFKQAGFDLSDSLLLTKSAMDLVIAGNIDASQSSELIIATLKGFGAEAKEATRLVNILNEVSNAYATNVEQLGLGMSRISPIANQMGFSFEETAGILTPIIEIFRSGSEAADGLKTGLLKLIDDSKPVREALESIGVSQFDVNGQMRSGKDIYLDVAKAFQGMDENQKLFITQQLVGIEQSARMVKVFDNLALSSEITGVALKSSGSAAKEVEERLKSAEVSVKKFTAGFDNLAITVGNQFRDAAKSAIDGGTEIESALKNMIAAGTFDQIFNAIESFATDIGTTLSGIAKNLPEAFESVDFDDLLESFRGIGSSISEIFEGVDLATPKGLATAIQFVVDSLESLNNVTAGIIDSFKPLISASASLAKSFNDLDPEAQKTIGSIAGFGAALVTLGGILGVGGILLSGIGSLAAALSAAGSLAGGIAGTTLSLSGGAGLIAMLTGPVGLTAALAATALAIAKFSFGQMEIEHNKSIAVIKAQTKSIEDLIATMGDVPAHKSSEIFVLIEKGDLEGAKKLIDEITLEEKSIKIKAEADQKELNEFFEAWSDIPAEKEIELTAAINAGDFEKVNDILSGLTEKKTVEITAVADVKKAKEEIEWFDEEGNRHTIVVDVNSDGVKKAKSEIEKLPSEKMLEIQLQGDIDIEIEKIKAVADLAQSAFEWSAKIDIAQAEAAAATVKAAFESVGQSVSSIATSVGDMFSALIGGWEDLGTVDRNILLRDIEKQMDMQSKLVESQIRLTAAQAKLLEKQAEAIDKGDALIKITSDGLEPALEMIMWEIIKKVQIRATESASDFLLGIA